MEGNKRVPLMKKNEVEQDEIPNEVVTILIEPVLLVDVWKIKFSTQKNSGGQQFDLLIYVHLGEEGY
jgi:hypothetical protein